MPVLTATQISQADLKADVEDLLDKLVNGKPEHSLEFAARLADERAAAHHTHGLFKTWSMNNRMFLEAQARRRGASLKFLFAGVDQWRKMNREVVESELERNYSIWGSPVYRVREKQAAGAGQNAAANNAAAPAAAPGNAGELRFRRPAVLAVYDWTQTRSLDENYEEPSWDVPLAYGDYATLNTLVESSPVPVTFADLSARNESGWLDHTGITVDERADIGNQNLDTGARARPLLPRTPRHAGQHPRQEGRSHRRGRAAHVQRARRLRAGGSHGPVARDEDARPR